MRCRVTDQHIGSMNLIPLYSVAATLVGATCKSAKRRCLPPRRRAPSMPANRRCSRGGAKADAIKFYLGNPPWRTSPVAVATRKPGYNYLYRRNQVSTDRVVLALARVPTRHRRAAPPLCMMRGGRAVLSLAAVVLAPALLYLMLRRRRRLLVPRILARYPCEVSGRTAPWYTHVVVTELSTDGQVTVRGLHFDSASNPPESVVRLVPTTTSGWKPIASALDKAYAPFALLPFALTGGGFAPSSRACLIGVAGGSLLHVWLGCVPGGASLQVDAVELDGAVLRAAREHLGLGCCEATGRVAIHQADGAAFIAAAGDEVYDMLMLDLDGVSESAYSMADEVAARAAYREAYRVLSERGVLVVNEYSESAAHERLEAMLRSVRVLRRFFAQVTVLRTTAHNLMFIATVQRVALPGDGDPFDKLCAAADRLSFVGGLELDLGTRLRELGSKKCFSSFA